MGIKEWSPLGDKCEDPRAERPPEQGIIFQLLVNACRSIGARLNQDNSTGNPLRPAEHPQHIRAKVHIISQIPEFLIYVESLGKENDLDLVVSLELEPVTNFGFEVFVVPIVPDHAHFIYQEEGLRRDFLESDIFVIDIDAAV